MTVLAGVDRPEPVPWAPFDPRVTNFLEQLSAEVLRHPETRGEAGVAAFAFWCRRGHLTALARRHETPLPRLGVGLVFHIAPGNVPVMFAYTLAIGLLAGNANIVRLSRHRADGDTALLEALRRVSERHEHAQVRRRFSLVTYPRDEKITAAYCAACDGRVVWGGDETVAAVRAMPMPPHAVELCFPHRWSLALFSQSALAAMDGEALEELARRFYNDTYQMDQNACSSPQLMLWLEDGGGPACREKWWAAVAAQAARSYPFGAFQAARKLERLYLGIMTLEGADVTRISRWEGNLLHVAHLERLPDRLEALRGGFGLFYQCGVAGLEEVLSLLTPRVQTLVCWGVERERVTGALTRFGARGVYRVVTPGQAMELDTLWDGKDMIAQLSRLIG